MTECSLSKRCKFAHVSVLAAHFKARRHSALPAHRVSYESVDLLGIPRDYYRPTNTLLEYPHMSASTSEDQKDTKAAVGGSPTPASGGFLPFLKTVVSFVIVLTFLRASVVEAFRIPSASMKPTLIEGDHILVNKLSYGLRFPFVPEALFEWSEPTRGDIVVFTRPDDPKTVAEDESDTNLIKRVIGLPGDRIEVRGDEVLLNGSVYTEDARYAKWVNGGVNDFGPVTVPAGRVLLLGDNRDQSKDSRFWEDSPFLDMRRIKGRAFIIYWNSGFFFNRMFTILR